MYRWPILFVGLIIGILGLTENSWSQLRECHLRSEITNNAAVEKHNWLVRFEYDKNGRELVRRYFIADSAISEPAFATLCFAADGDVILFGVDGQEIQHGKNYFLIRLGYPLPVDVLPVMPIGSSRHYTVIRETQGLKFKRHFTLTVESISLIKASEHGFITGKSDLADRLLLYKLVDGSGKRVLMQIREEGVAMWLYEETDVRCSWRLN